MSRRSSKASLRTSSNKASGEIEFHFETGESYRPYTSVERIKSIDAKKLSNDDPRLSNISKEVPRENMRVFSINEAKDEDFLPSSFAVEMIVKSEEHPPTLSSFHLGDKIILDTQPCYNQEQTFDLRYDGSEIEYLEQPSFYDPQYEVSPVSVNSPTTTHSPALAILTDFLKPCPDDEYLHEFSLASTITTPVSGLPYPSPQTEVYSPTDSYTSSPDISGLSSYDYLSSEQPIPYIYYSQDSRLAELYPVGYNSAPQYPEPMSLPLQNYTGFHESSYDSLTSWLEQKPFTACSNAEGNNSPNVGYFNV